MQKPQIDTYDMILSVENKFDENPTMWRDNVPVTDTLALIAQEVDLLTTQVGIQLESHTGITDDKARIRKELEAKAFLIAAGANAYAVTNNKGNLARHTHYPITTLERYRDAEFYSVCITLHRDCRNEEDALIPYGITETVLEEFTTATTAFSEIMKDPQDAISIKKEATDAIARLLPKITDLLKTRLDNLMLAFKATQPEFVEQYFNLRAIKSTGVRHLSLTVSTLDAVTKNPVFKAKLEIVGEDIKRLSSKRGYNKVAHLSEGNHELTISHPDYRPKTVSFTVVSGETTELVVFMEAL